MILRRSAKNKGKRLEKWLRDTILTIFPELHADDARVPIGSQFGPDIILSAKAKTYLPFSFECKAREQFKTLYAFYDQAANKKDGLPLVVLKMNNRTPIAIIDAEYLLTLIKRANDAEIQPK